MKKLILILAILMLPKAFAMELEDVTTLRDSAYRVGTSDEVEIKYQVKDRVNDNIVKKEEEIIDSRALTYADLSIKKISKEISDNLNLKSNDMMKDLSLLWRGAAVKSDTIKFALYKLSNPDADNCKYVNTCWCRCWKSSSCIRFVFG